jgi:UDP-N-acetylglucosamine 2-epimerase (hydrolysing)
MKKILFLSGTRADFGKMKNLMRYVESCENFELHVLVTGMHMMKLYGSTQNEIRREDFRNIYCISNQFQCEAMPSVFGNTVSIASRLVEEVEPDLIVVHGDRLEALAGATVGALGNRLVCHIEGGELSGTIDDLIRHSISKLSHVHMVANEEAKMRLVQMGEPAESIYIIGSPDLDAMNEAHLPSLDSVRRHYDILFNDYAISMFHPVTTEFMKTEEHAKAYFDALEESGESFVVIYPNNDQGSEFILRELRKRESFGNFKMFPSVRFESFLVLLKNAKFVIGNSSAGIREAPYFGIPAVNVGSRQNRRSIGRSIINCGNEIESIRKAIHGAKNMRDIKRSTWFGSGDSLGKFVRAINTAEFWGRNLQKRFVDLQ